MAAASKTWQDCSKKFHFDVEELVDLMAEGEETRKNVWEVFVCDHATGWCLLVSWFQLDADVRTSWHRTPAWPTWWRSAVLGVVRSKTCFGRLSWIDGLFLFGWSCGSGCRLYDLWTVHSTYSLWRWLGTFSRDDRFLRQWLGQVVVSHMFCFDQFFWEKYFGRHPFPVTVATRIFRLGILMNLHVSLL